MVDCQELFSSTINNKNLVEVLLFSEENCRGEIIRYSKDGEYKLSDLLKSFIIPENYKLRLFKNLSETGETIHVDFNHSMWGIGIDNVEHSIDLWKNNFGENVHSSFEDIKYIDIEKLGDRDSLIASSCVGLHEPPIYLFEPSKNGSLNNECENFLDIYCTSSDPYSRDLCKHRNTFVLSVDESDKSSSYDETLYIIIYVIFGSIAIFVILLFVWGMFFNSKTNSRKQINKLGLKD
jgi:hypothetical protein